MWGWVRSSRGFVAVGASVALVAASLGVVLGSDATRSLFDLGDGLAWLGSNENGELLLVDGASGQPVGVNSSAFGERTELSVVHEGGVAYVTADGKKLYRIDASEAYATQDLAEGERIVRGGDRAYLVNEKVGTVRPVDQRSLELEGEPLEFDTGIRAEADGDGRLVVVEVARGRVHVVTGSSSGSPMELAKSRVRLVGAGDVPTVVDLGGRSAFAFERGEATEVRLPESPGRRELVPRTAEVAQVGILSTAAGSGRLVMVDVESGRARALKVRADLDGVKDEGVLVAKRAVYLVDRSKGRVVVVDPADGAVRDTLSFADEVGRGDDLEVFVKDGFLWVNNPGGDKAAVINADAEQKVIDKYETEGLPEIGGEVQEEPSNVAAPGPGVAPGGAAPGSGGPAGGGAAEGGGGAPSPVAGAPGAPVNFEATPGNKTVNLSWQRPANGGAQLTHYELDCTPNCGRSSTRIDAGSEAYTVEGLRNGTEYTFQLQAVNSISPGPAASAGPVTPTAEVPLPPTNIEAVANGDGTVAVTWTPPDAEGLELDGFDVTAVRDDGTEIPFDAGTGSELTTDPDALAYDDDDQPDWRFFVATRAQLKSGDLAVSEDSDPSNKVDPYNAPTFPPASQLSISGGNRQLSATWPAAFPRGRPVVYELTCAPACPAVTVDGLTGSATELMNGEAYTVSVVAVGDGGESAALTDNTEPGGNPAVRIVGSGPLSSTSIYVDLVVDDWNGRPGTCDGQSGTICRVTQGGLGPARNYTLEACATNAAGLTSCASANPRTSGVSAQVDAVTFFPTITASCSNTVDHVGAKAGPDYNSATQSCVPNGTTLELLCETTRTDTRGVRDQYGTASYIWYRDSQRGYLNRWWIAGWPDSLGLPPC